MVNRGNQVIDVEAEVVLDEVKPEQPAAEQPSVRSELVVGIDTVGSIYYLIQGPDQSLITVSGLRDYLNIEIDRLWSKALDSRNQQSQ